MKKVRKFLAIAMVGVLAITLVACGNEENMTVKKAFSFSGECEEFRIVDGVAEIGGDKDYFYGGKLELKTEKLSNVKKYTGRFYVVDNSEKWSIMIFTREDETNTFTLNNYENGEISGSIINANIDEKAFEENLYFEMEIVDEKGDTKVYTVPMEVKEK